MSILVLGGIWFFTGWSPLDTVKNLAYPSTNGVSSESNDLYLYKYSINVGKPYNDRYDYTVSINVSKRTSDTICYTYHIVSIENGDAGFIKGYMRGFYGVNEDEPICSELHPEKLSPKYHLVSSDTTVTGMKTGNGYSYKYSFENGVLRSLSYSYIVNDNGKEVPVKLNIEFLGIKTINQSRTETSINEQTPTTTTITTSIVPKHGVLSSLNVSVMTYRVIW